MSRKTDKIIKRMLCGFGLAVLSVISGIAGMQIERSYQRELEIKKEHVSTIAVVNMDDGVLQDTEHINYASKLMSFPSESFVVTGLTDAKAGIENGSYAAYIVIPETFSASVTSIENDPKKVTLGYQYNPRLDEEAKVQAVYQVNAFINLFNSNIAYMYMDAILAEFHRVQDDSAAILANDNAELNLLESVNIPQLIGTAEPIEEGAVDYDVEQVDIASYITQNDALMEALFLGYTQAVEEGITDYGTIQETSAGVDVAAEEFFSTYQTVLEDTAAEQAVIMEEGKESLEEAVGAYNQEVISQKEEIERITAEVINRQFVMDQEAADTQLINILQTVEQDNDRALSQLQTEWETAYGNLKEQVQAELQNSLGNTPESAERPIEAAAVRAYEKGFYDVLAILDAQIQDQEGEEEITVESIRDLLMEYKAEGSIQNIEECHLHVEELKQETSEILNAVCIDWDRINTTLPVVPNDTITEDMITGDTITDDTETPGDTESAGGTETPGGTNPPPEEPEESYRIILTERNDEGEIGSIAEGILELFTLEPKAEEIDEVIQTYFVDALAEESQDQMSRLQDAELLLEQSMGDYENSLLEYDPMKYIENAELDTYLTDIENNTGEMMDSVEQNHFDYMLYADDVYAVTTENTEKLKASLEEANEQTSSNVTDCLGELILSREAVNSQNTDMLETFTGALRYTRVESQGNAEVYDYIVNPVATQINSKPVSMTAGAVSGKGSSIKGWLMLVLGIGIAGCIIGILTTAIRQRRNIIS